MREFGKPEARRGLYCCLRRLSQSSERGLRLASRSVLMLSWVVALCSFHGGFDSHALFVFQSRARTATARINRTCMRRSRESTDNSEHRRIKYRCSNFGAANNLRRVEQRSRVPGSVIASDRDKMRILYIESGCQNLDTPKSEPRMAHRYYSIRFMRGRHTTRHCICKIIALGLMHYGYTVHGPFRNEDCENTDGSFSSSETSPFSGDRVV